MEIATASKVARIRSLNDDFRTSFMGGQVLLTAGVAALDDNLKARVLEAVRKFTKFDQDNDPHGEHDFISVQVGDEKVIGKIDYYDMDMAGGSEDPSDPAQTKRVLTIMLCEEY